MHEHADSTDDIGTSPQEFRGRGDGFSPTLIGLVVLVVGAVVFVIQNSDTAKVRFLFFTVTTRLWAGILVALVVGALFDRLLSMWWRRRRERT